MMYTIKPLVVAYEVPSLDLKDQTGCIEMVNQIFQLIPANIGVLGKSCEAVELPNSNIFFNLSLILSIESETMSKTEFMTVFKDIVRGVQSAMEKFLKDRNILYKRVKLV